MGVAYNPLDMAVKRSQSNATTWLAVTAVLLFWYLALNSLIADSPTMDEQNHLARGLAFLRTGDPRLSLEHPPLVNSLSALPLLTMPQIRLPTEAPSWQRQPPDVYWYLFAEEMIWETNRDLDIQQIFILARLPIVYLTLGLALVGFHFGRELWGGWAALLAFGCLLFDPNILANGRYVTTDLGGALFALLATFLLWRLWRQANWNWRRWLWAVLALGLAFGSKLSILGFVIIWGVLALLPLYPDPGQKKVWRGVVRRLLQLLSAGLASILVVWALFGFEWGHFWFQNEPLRALNLLTGPMPTFWAGIEKILTLTRNGRPGFLLGQFSDAGFGLYFPVAFLVKTPLLTMALFFLATIILLALRSARQNALFLLLPILIYFTLSMQAALNLGYRHLLPILPFIYLLISGLAGKQVSAWLQLRVGFAAQRAVEYAALGFVLLLLLVAARIHPHYLSYFNLAAGGPKNGHKILVDSNIDWGQDLLRLKSWMLANKVDLVNLAWFGTADPDYYGIQYKALPGFPRQPFLSQWTQPPFNPAAPEPGIYAISASNLWELQLAEKNVYPWFRAREPDDRVGYSILIYEVQ